MVQGKLGIIKRNLYGKYSVYDNRGVEISELTEGSLVCISIRRACGGYLHVVSKIEYNGKKYVAVEAPQVLLDGLICRILL